MQISPLKPIYPARTNFVCPKFVSQPALNPIRFGENPEQPKTLFQKIRAWALGITLFSAGVGSGVVGTRTYDYATTPHPHRVTHIVDGDTFDLGNGERARIYGIDAPEEGQPFYEESKQALEKLTSGRVVELKQKGKSFDRKVYQVFLRGQDIGELMVKQGQAFAEEKYAHGVYKEAEKEASKSKSGVWQQKDGGIRPWDFRKQKKS